MGGCSESSSVPLDKYLTRLANSLDRPITLNANRLPPLPRSRDLHIDPQSHSIGLLDLLALNGCEISITIGNINSSLGKLASDSQRLLLELEFLSLAPACISSLDQATDGELITTLQTAMAEKHRMLSARIWNATLGGPEFRAFWKRPHRLGNYPANTGGQISLSLARLAKLSSQWLDGNYEAGSGELEGLLGDVRSGDGGALLAALDLQRSALTAAAPAIQQRLDGASICIDNTPSPEGRIVENVVRKFFIGEVQVWSVLVARRRNQLMPPVLALEQSLQKNMPDDYQTWARQRDHLLTSAVDAPREHARHLAALLESCGLRPGVDVGYSITPEFETSVGYYYQKGGRGAADGSGVQGRVAYNIGSGFSIGTNLSYDDAFDGRVSADILYRFASPEATKAPVNKAWNAPTIKGLSDTVSNRDVRVHDLIAFPRSSSLVLF